MIRLDNVSYAYEESAADAVSVVFSDETLLRVTQLDGDWLLTSLEIFESLTARDRPYKPPMPAEKAWDILDSMVREGALDGSILSEFRESGAWTRILSPEQVSGTDR